MSDDNNKKRDLIKYSILFGMIYFVQGTGTPSSGIASQPIMYLLKDVMLLTAAQAAYFLSIMSIAWNIKPLYGLLSDFVPFFGYRRKSYLILMNLMSFVAWITLVLLKDYVYWQILPVLMCCSLGFAFSDVVCDGLMVQTGKPLGMTGRFQAIQWGVISFAAILSGFGGGWVAEHLTYKQAFLIASVFPLMTILTTIIVVKEEKASRNTEQMKETWAAVKQGFKSKTLWGVIAFIFCWNFSPSFGAPFFYYMRDHLHFSKMFIGTLGSIDAGAGIVGAILFWTYCRNISLNFLLRFTVVLGTVATLSYLLIIPPMVNYLPMSPAVFIIMTGIIFGSLGMISHLALLDLSAKACPKFAEGTIFAMLMSIFNIGTFGSRMFGGWLYDMVGMMPLILISTVFTAACWFLIRILDLKSIENPDGGDDPGNTGGTIKTGAKEFVPKPIVPFSPLFKGYSRKD